MSQCFYHPDKTAKNFCVRCERYSCKLEIIQNPRLPKNKKYPNRHQYCPICYMDMKIKLHGRLTDRHLAIILNITTLLVLLPIIGAVQLAYYDSQWGYALIIVVIFLFPASMIQLARWKLKDRKDSGQEYRDRKKKFIESLDTDVALQMKKKDFSGSIISLRKVWWRC